MPTVSDPHKAADKPPTAKERARLGALREMKHRTLIDGNPDALFVVGGLWCADFIGSITRKYFRSAEFRVERFVVPPTTDHTKAGDVVHVIYNAERLTLSIHQGE